MKVIRYNGDVSELKPIAVYWFNECNRVLMNIEITANSFFSNLQEFVDGDNSDLLVLIDNEPIGILGLTTFKSPLGNQLMTNEHFWYVIPSKRGLSSIMLFNEAEKWAREKGCSHLIMTASNLASSLHDKMCSLYQKLGMEKFETSFIKKI